MHFKLDCRITLSKIRLVSDVASPSMIIFCEAGNRESGGVLVRFLSSD